MMKEYYITFKTNQRNKYQPYGEDMKRYWVTVRLNTDSRWVHWRNTATYVFKQLFAKEFMIRGKYHWTCDTLNELSLDDYAKTEFAIIEDCELWVKPPEGF